MLLGYSFNKLKLSSGKLEISSTVQIDLIFWNEFNANVSRNMFAS